MLNALHGVRVEGAGRQVGAIMVINATVIKILFAEMYVNVVL